MQSINIILSFSVLLLIVLFLSVTDHASVIQVAGSGHEHHHMSDVESVDEEPTQQHQLKIELQHPVWLPVLKSSGSIDSNFYPSPFFDITAPPPEC